MTISDNPVMMMPAVDTEGGSRVSSVRMASYRT